VQTIIQVSILRIKTKQKNRKDMRATLKTHRV